MGFASNISYVLYINTIITTETYNTLCILQKEWYFFGIYIINRTSLIIHQVETREVMIVTVVWILGLN